MHQPPAEHADINDNHYIQEWRDWRRIGVSYCGYYSTLSTKFKCQGNCSHCDLVPCRVVKNEIKIDNVMTATREREGDNNEKKQIPGIHTEKSTA